LSENYNKEGWQTHRHFSYVCTELYNCAT